MYINLPFLLIYVSLPGLFLVRDLCIGLLPDKFIYPLLWGGLIYHQCCRPTQLSDALWGAVAGCGVFALLYWGYHLICRQEGLGFGGVKFLAALGAWYRWESLPLLVLFAAGIACCPTGISYIRYGKQVLKNSLPFGPYLVAVGFVIGLLGMIQGGQSLALIYDYR